MTAALALKASPDEMLETIKRTLCPQGIPDPDLIACREKWTRAGLDPLKGECFIVKRRNNIGTKTNEKWVDKYEVQPSDAGLLCRAERFPDCRGVTGEAVYSGDSIEIDAGAGAVSHRFNPAKDRGQLIGAWARVEREGRTAAIRFLKVAERKQDTHFWGKDPAGMILKCARAAVLRVAYPDQFGGLYLREEMPPTNDHDAEPKAAPRLASPKPSPKAERPAALPVDEEPADIPTDAEGDPVPEALRDTPLDPRIKSTVKDGVTYYGMTRHDAESMLIDDGETPPCPACGGTMREQLEEAIAEQEANPKTPVAIFACQDQTCAKSGGLIWLDRKTAKDHVAAARGKKK